MKKGFGFNGDGTRLCRLIDVSAASPVCRTSMILTVAAVDDDNL
jgi:hypothetical protein